MVVWASDENTGISIGVNDCGELFLGSDTSGYNLIDTPENREYIECDYRYYTGKNVKVPGLKIADDTGTEDSD